MFKIVKLETKGKDWKVVSVLNSAGEIVPEVSINRISKKGDIFPDFDELAEGQKIDARLWESPSNKMYLFAPKGSAKAPVKQTPYEKAEDDEYPVSAKLETILNKMTGMQIDIQIIKELITPKKKAVVDLDEPEFEDTPF